MPDAVIFAWFVLRMSNHRFLPPCTDFLKFRIFFDFDPPSLVIGEVKVEMVDLV